MPPRVLESWVQQQTYFNDSSLTAPPASGTINAAITDGNLRAVWLGSAEANRASRQHRADAQKLDDPRRHLRLGRSLASERSLSGDPSGIRSAWHASLCDRGIAAHTVGGVVAEAQPILTIVPVEDVLEVEAFLENKDIGFVDPGQDAEIKVETFPYTKYGTLHATVTHVSHDAINDEKRGLIYSARVKMERATMRVEEKTVNLTPGMAVTVEIKTGRRRVIDYFLSPLIQYKDESLRER